MEKLACNLCSQNKPIPLYTDVSSWEHPGNFTLVKCSNCNLVYLNPRPRRTEIARYYPPESYWGRNVNQTEQQAHLLKEREQGYKFLYQKIFSRQTTGSILDIGAGTGLFLSAFKEKGWQAEGVEFSPEAVKFGEQMFGLQMKVGDFLDHTFRANTFDVVTLNNALEHLFDPQKTLIEVNRIMKPNGLLVVTVPNIESLGFKIFGKEWYALQPPRHLYHFSSMTLSQMMKAAGFRVLTVDHGYRIHNYAALFESFRLKLSPKFAKKVDGGLAGQAPSRPNAAKVSLKKEFAKVVFKTAATLLAILGTFLHQGETICIVAEKK